MSDRPGESWWLSPAYLRVGRGSKGSDSLPRTLSRVNAASFSSTCFLVASAAWGMAGGSKRCRLVIPSSDEPTKGLLGTPRGRTARLAPRQTLWPLPASKEHSVQVDRGRQASGGQMDCPGWRGASICSAYGMGEVAHYQLPGSASDVAMEPKVMAKQSKILCVGPAVEAGQCPQLW
jgi:hypothetical protein